MQDPRQHLGPFHRLPSDFTVLDTETTGLPRKGSQPGIVTMGLVRVEGGVIQAEKEFYVRPHVAVEPQAAQVHGYTDRLVRSDPRFRPFPEVWGEARAWLEGRHVLMHNQQFDWGVLAAALAHHRLPELHATAFCSLKATRKWAVAEGIVKKSSSRGARLDLLVEHLGVAEARTGHHGALADAKLTTLAILRLRQLAADFKASGGVFSDEAETRKPALLGGKPYYVVEYKDATHPQNGDAVSIHALPAFIQKALPKLKANRGIARAWYVLPRRDATDEVFYIVGSPR